MAAEYWGIYPAFVSSVNDPEKRGRIKVTCAEVFNNTSISSAWATPITPVGIENGGDFFVPEVDEGVFLMFLNGDVNKPVWIGGWWGANATPLGGDYQPNKKRVINFKDTTITMQDKECKIEAGGGVEITIKDGKISIKGDVDVDGNITATGTITP